VPSGFEQRLIDLKHRLAKFREKQISLEPEAKIQGLPRKFGEELDLTMAAAHPASRWAGTAEPESEGLGDLAVAISIASANYEEHLELLSIKVPDRYSVPPSRTDRS
jgi:hypothetical protein